MKRSDTKNPNVESLLKSTLWYSAAATAVLGLAVDEANSQVVYTDVDPDAIVMDTYVGGSTPLPGYSVDFDGDGDAEMFFAEQIGGNYTLAGVGALAEVDGMDAVSALLGTTFLYGGNPYAYFAPLSLGAPIGGTAPNLLSGYSNATFTFGGSDPLSWLGAGEAYLGVQFSLDGATHYGWVRVEVTSGQIRVLDFAYEATPDTAIEAGAMGVAIEPGPDGTPGTHNLSSIYPNPFNPQAQFSLEIAEPQNVSIAVFDALGREVAILHNGTLGAGTIHQFQIDGANLPSGIYVVRAIGERFTDVRQVTLLK